MFLLEFFLNFVQSSKDATEPGVVNPENLFVNCNVFKDFKDHRDVQWKSSVVMCIGIYQNLSEIDLVDCNRLTSRNSQLADPTAYSFEIGQSFIVDTFIGELKPGIQNFVSNAQNWFF